MLRLLKCTLALGMAVCLAMSSSAARADYVDELDAIAGADKISYWNLQETSGAEADLWGSNDGTYSGAGITRGAAGPRPSDGFLGFSPTNNAAAFEGDTSQLLQMADSASFAGAQSLTLLMWFQIPEGTSGGDRVLGGLQDQTFDVSGRYGFLLDSRSSAMRGGVRVWDGVGVPPDGEANVLSDNAASSGRDSIWHFAALTMEPDGLGNKSVTVYFDGVPDDTPSTMSGAGSYGLSPRHTSASTGILAFANDPGADNNRAFLGSLDEIAFVGRALSAGEINQLWNAALVPEPGSVVLLGIGGVIGLAAIRRRRAMKK